MQIDLSVNTALPLALEGIELRFGADVEPVAPTVRLAGEMRELFYAPAVVDSKQQLYFMYHGICLNKDQELIERHGLRYDITIMPPALIGPEYVKTMGITIRRQRGQKRPTGKCGVVQRQAHFCCSILIRSLTQWKSSPV